MKTRHLPSLGFGLLLLLASGWLHAQPALNGLAINSEFGKERFIAALYTDSRSRDADAILNSAGHRRMELKVVADSISARSINSMWIEGMAINNPAAALEAQAENLAKLNNLVRKRLRAGDVLVFDSPAGGGTTVSVNGVRLGTINSPDFFSMLLRTWIGSIPLSSEFKDSLLAAGDVDANLSARYGGIEPDEARVDAVATWVAPTPPQPAVAASQPLQPPKPEISIPSSAPSRSEEPKVAEEAPAPQPAEPAAEEPAEAQTAAAEPKPAAPAQQPEPKPQVASRPAAPAPAPAEEEEDEDVEEVMVTAQSLLLRQRYISDVMHKTLGSMQYPRRAQERRQEGSIRLAVVVNRKGELQSVQVVEESRHSLLNREAVASVERANPFPAVPEGIAGESFAFGIPVTFRLQ